ncbi:MAG: polymer-forming cytoskeletal protein [Spirochaetia bacterium]|jgi:cytoskeletal protein CcmA (bactofilin family)|nr:polymer-forming cytoskeletal protein [Spirochaetia bacterium]
MVDVRIKNVEESDADTLLSEDMSFQGTMSLSRPAMIKGQVTGKIESDSNVFIEKEADVKADIKADELSVKGNLAGSVQASVIELGSTAVFSGDIKAQSLAMESGCTFSGSSQIGHASKAEQEAPAEEAPAQSEE